MNPLHVFTDEEERTDFGNDDADGSFLDASPESLAATGAAIAAGMVTRRVLTTVWKKWRQTNPPTNPAAPGVKWGDALIWAVAVGATAGVARVLSRRTAVATVNRLRSSA